MNRILSIAFNDYRQTVLTKTFLISILLMPLVFLGILVVQVLASDVEDTKDRRVAIIDRSGTLFEELQSKARRRNQRQIFRGEGEGKKQVRPRIVIEPCADGGTRDGLLLDLSRRVREGDLFAFVIIGKDVVSPQEGSDNKILYYSNSPTSLQLAVWLEKVSNEKIESVRFESVGIDRRIVNKLKRRVVMERLELPEKTDEGEIKSPEKIDLRAAFTVPFGALMVLFVTVNLSAPGMLNSIMEEKMQKIAEVLLASVPPFQIMLGKLLASTMVGLTFATVYLSCLYGILTIFEGEHLVPSALFVWFFVFMILALLTFGSMWAAIGAACADIKDTQNFAGLTVMMIMPPLILAPPVLQSPTSSFSAVVSLIPPFTPMLMFLRLAVPPGPAPWEVAMGIFLSTGFALFSIWAAGRVFRVGLLAQGQTPSFRQIVSWIFSK